MAALNGAYMMPNRNLEAKGKTDSRDKFWGKVEI